MTRQIHESAPDGTSPGTVPPGATREWLDAQYNARALVPDADAILAGWRLRSDAVRAEHPPVTVRYGEHPRQVADVFRPVDAGPGPLVVFVHGGYWQALDQETFAFLAAPFLAAGAVFASLDYRLVPEVALAEVVADARAGVAELSRRAAELGADPQRLVVVGHSAGGHLVAMLLATDWSAYGLRRGVVAGGVGVSGLYDLEPIRRCYLNDVLGLTEQDARRDSPVFAVPSAPGPLLLTCGGDEPGEFDRQQRLLAAAWDGDGVDVSILAQPDGTHFDACARLAEPGPLQDAVLSLVAGSGPR